MVEMQIHTAIRCFRLLMSDIFFFFLIFMILTGLLNNVEYRILTRVLVAN